MPGAENPRVATAAPTSRFAALSKRQWQDIRRARKLGADGLGGGLRVHGVEIFFPRPQKDVIQRCNSRRLRGKTYTLHTTDINVEGMRARASKLLPGV